MEGLTGIRVERFAVFEFHGPLANARLQSDVMDSVPGWSRALLACAPTTKREKGADGAAGGAVEKRGQAKNGGDGAAGGADKRKMPSINVSRK